MSSRPTTEQIVQAARAQLTRVPQMRALSLGWPIPTQHQGQVRLDLLAFPVEGPPERRTTWLPRHALRVDPAEPHRAELVSFQPADFHREDFADAPLSKAVKARRELDQAPYDLMVQHLYKVIDDILTCYPRTPMTLAATERAAIERFVGFFDFLTWRPDRLVYRMLYPEFFDWVDEVVELGRPGSPLAAELRSGTLADFRRLQKRLPDLADAPATVSLSENLTDAFRELADANPMIQSGGLLVIGTGGRLELVSPGQGNPLMLAPAGPAPLGQERAGVFHSHPLQGGGLSFSAGDMLAMLRGGMPLEIVQSGADQFLLLRTAQTPERVDRGQVTTAYDKRLAPLLTAGRTLAEASRIAARETAGDFRLAYYEGRDGTLHRIAPIGQAPPPREAPRAAPPPAPPPVSSPPQAAPVPAPLPIPAAPPSQPTVAPPVAAVEPSPRPVAEETATGATDRLLPESPALAPAEMSLSEEVVEQLQELLRSSPDRQRGGVLRQTQGKELALSLQEGGGQRHCFLPDAGPRQATDVVGAAHTHPAEGEGVSFSGGDIAVMVNCGAMVDIVVSGPEQFLLARTGQTPAQMNRAQVEAAYQGAILKALTAGKSLAQGTRSAAAEAAALCKLAYYEGKDGHLEVVR
jgi:hypothetical protein